MDGRGKWGLCLEGFLGYFHACGTTRLVFETFEREELNSRKTAPFLSILLGIWAWISHVTRLTLGVGYGILTTW